MTITGKIQQIQQMKSIDVAAVTAGVAVWQEWVPIAVGIFTVLWLGMQMIINFPKMCAVIKSLINYFKGKE